MRSALKDKLNTYSSTTQHHILVLEIINGLLYSGDDCPYGIQELYVISAGGVVTEIYFNNEPHTKI